MDLGPRQASAVVKLLSDGATVPFIARYRKEATGSLNEVVIRNIQKRLLALSQLDSKKATVTAAIEAAGDMTDKLRERIENCYDPVELEDIYMPYRPRRKTRATQARERGLEPLAKMIMAQEIDDVNSIAGKYITKSSKKIDPELVVPTIDAAISGASDIIAEWVSDSEKARNLVRSRFQRVAMIVSKGVNTDSEEARKYKDYFNFSELLRLCPSHRYMAMRRGEQEGYLKIDITIGEDDKNISDRLCRMFVKHDATPECSEIVSRAVKDSYKRLIRPSIVNEMASAAKERSDDAAIAVFADNLKSLLMAPPLGRKKVMGVDPGLKSGCKLACLDAQGGVMACETIYPLTDYYHSADIASYLIDRFRIDVIAIGNGTGCRETVNFFESLNLPHNVSIRTVSEQGASVYSASDVAREEFPDLDLTLRGAISIGRRLLDPLAELVKIEPRSIGVGQYQHSIDPAALAQELDNVVESCVNSVGVDVNTASRQLLERVSGIGPKLAGYIIDYRNENGPFRNRQELMNVPRMGAKAFQQSAGFLRIHNGDNPLDATAIHPEVYPLIERMAADMGVETERLVRDSNLYNSIELDKYATRKLGIPTLTDIILEFQKPGRDPRANDSTTRNEPVSNGVNIEDLHIGMELNGKVVNLTAFGVFVDIGLHFNGLIHVSQLSDDFVTSPADIVRPGQLVRVKVIDIDVARNRVALTLRGVPQNQ